MQFRPIDLSVPDRLHNPYTRIHQVKPPELKLPFPLSIFPGRRRLALILLAWLRPVIKDLLRYAVEMGRDLIDRIERDADDVLDMLEDEVGRRL